MKTSKKADRAGRRLYRLCLVDGVLDPARVRRVAASLAGSTRSTALPVLASFQRFVRLDRDQHRAVVESALPLAPALREAIRADLTRRYGPGIDTTFTENPALIAGMRITAGSDVYDGSVRARLDALAAQW